MINWDTILNNPGLIGVIITIILVIVGAVVWVIRYFLNLHMKINKIEKEISKVNEIEGRLRKLETENAGNTSALNIIQDNVSVILKNNLDVIKNKKNKK